MAASGFSTERLKAASRSAMLPIVAGPGQSSNPIEPLVGGSRQPKPGSRESRSAGCLELPARGFLHSCSSHDGWCFVVVTRVNAPRCKPNKSRASSPAQVFRGVSPLMASRIKSTCRHHKASPRDDRQGALANGPAWAAPRITGRASPAREPSELSARYRARERGLRWFSPALDVNRSLMGSLGAIRGRAGAAHHP